ncbi:archease [Natronomonas sp. EA1]|uniref:archease n=1 Tax=Natronomonas sp. EA1 TaxID=3421655 RepID=UPI003EB824B1
MSYELRDHTADVAVHATGGTLDAVFAAVADGLTAAMCETVPETGGEVVELSVTAERKEALLFEYLDELIYERDVRGVLPTDHAVTVDPETWTLDASFRGVPFEAVTAREVKAVTYSEMRLEPVEAGWEAYVVFDV